MDRELRKQPKILLIGQLQDWHRTINSYAESKIFCATNLDSGFKQVLKIRKEKPYLVIFIDSRLSLASEQTDILSLIQEIHALSATTISIVLSDLMTDSPEWFEQARQFMLKGSWGLAHIDVNKNNPQYILESIKKDPISFKKVADVCYKDKDLSRFGNEQLKILHHILALNFETFLRKRVYSHSKKPPSTWDLLDLILPDYNNKSISIKGCLNKIEHYLNTPLKSLVKTSLLIIDHDTTALDQNAYLLSPYFTIFKAPSSSDGLKIFKDKHPHLVLLKNPMLDRQKKNTLEEIKRIDKHSQIIGLSETYSSDEARKFIHNGAFDYLHKSIDPNYLSQQLNHAWIKRVWPLFESRVDIQKLDLMQRLCCLNHLINQRKKNNENKKPETLSCFQDKAWLNGLYLSDILGIFPEFTNIL